MDATSKTLAEAIAKRLVSEKVIKEEDTNAVIAKISAGKMLLEDWRVLVGKVLAEPKP